jgi:hypothetical protein
MTGFIEKVPDKINAFGLLIEQKNVFISDANFNSLYGCDIHALIVYSLFYDASTMRYPSPTKKGLVAQLSHQKKEYMCMLSLDKPKLNM